mgnify:CR=1 FL=1
MVTLKRDHKNIETRLDHNGFNITYKDQRKSPLLFVAIFWNFTLVTTLSTMFYNFESEGYKFEPFQLIFLIHPLVGLFLLYSALRGPFNKTTLLIKHDKSLNIKVSPFPLPLENKLINCYEIDQLFVEKYIAYKVNNKNVYKYKISYKNKTLIKNINHENDALSIEQAIESHLNIKNNPNLNKLAKESA